jgi:hypothetical protein
LADDAPRPPPVWPALAACAVAAAWIDLGGIQSLQYGDSVVPSLVSLLHWTPFYWDQDRFGMLVPLLAMPFRHPLANLLVQGGLNLFAGLASLVLLPRYVLRTPAWRVAGMANVVLFFVLAPAGYRFGYLVAAQPFGIPLSFALGALVLVERRPLAWPRMAMAAALMMLAHWVNVGTAVFVGPLVVARTLVALPRSPSGVEGQPRFRAELAVSLGLIAVGAGSGFALARLLARRATLMNPLPVSEWPAAWRAVAANAWSQLSPHGWVWTSLALAALGLALMAIPRLRPSASEPLRAAAALALAGAVCGLYVAALRWVKENDFDYRYVVPALIFWQTACVVLLAGLGQRVWRWAVPVGAAALLCAATWLYGFPSPARARGEVDRALGARTADILASGATHVLGDYWAVWPAVFHANLALYEQKSDRRLWGISHRSWATHEQWAAVPLHQMRIAVPRGDELWEHWRREYELPPLVRVEARPTIDLFSVQPEL